MTRAWRESSKTTRHLFNLGKRKCYHEFGLIVTKVWSEEWDIVKLLVEQVNRTNTEDH